MFSWLNNWNVSSVLKFVKMFCQLRQSSRQNSMLSVKTSAKHWYVQICTCRMYHIDIGGLGKPVTTFQNCVSTFVKVKQMDIFHEGQKHFNTCKHNHWMFLSWPWDKIQPCLCQHKIDVFKTRSWEIFSCVSGNKNSCF